nr:hypothetical protein [Microctonus hyperodae filamentous virus]
MSFTISNRVRLASFENWPETNPISKYVLCAAGFVYHGQNDTVSCPVCNIESSGWRAGDDPLAKHIMLNPQCPGIAWARGYVREEKTINNND